jgi:hypothetical protein
MLSAEQHSEFATRGVVRLAQAVESAVVEEFRERLLAFIAERKLGPENPGVWLAVKASRTAPVAGKYGFAELWGPMVVGALDALLGAGRWQVPQHAGQILPMTWPQPEQPWLLPHKSWHLDYRAPGSASALPGAQLFLCIDRVEPRNAATLVVAGIPRLIDAIRLRRGPGWEGRSADVRGTVIREVPWFSELASLRPGEDRIARFMEKPTEFDGGTLQVVELVGEPGDVWLMHPWMLHAGSANCGARPRMVLTERIRGTAG